MVRVLFFNPPVRSTEPPRHIPYGIAMLAAVGDQWGGQMFCMDANVARFNDETIRNEVKEIYQESKVPYDIFAFSGLITTYGWQKRLAKILKHDWPETMIIAGGGCASGLQRKMLEWVPEIDALCYGEGEITFIELLENAKRGELWSNMDQVDGMIHRPDLKKYSPPPIPELPETKVAWQFDTEKGWLKHKRLIDEHNWAIREKEKYLHTFMGERRKEPKTVKTKPRQLMTEEELGSLPFPKWDMFLLRPYGEKNLYVPGYWTYSSLDLSDDARMSKRRLDIVGERGCAGQCRFCSHNLMGGDYLDEEDKKLYEEAGMCSAGRITPLVRFFPVDWVVNCIKYARIRYSIDFIAFMDETLLLNKKRTMALCDGLVDAGICGDPEWGMRWGCLGRVENAEDELFIKLRDSGCTYISYGFESSSQPNLDYLEKGSTPKMQERAIKLGLDHGINTISSYIVGYPDETMQTLYDTTKFMVKYDIKGLPFLLTPYLYTRVYWENKEKILAKFKGDEEAFALACGDASDFVVNLTKRFKDAELLGLRDMVSLRDLDGLIAHSKWRVEKGFDAEPIIDRDPLPGRVKV